MLARDTRGRRSSLVMRTVIVGRDLSADVRQGFAHTPVAEHWQRGKYWSLETCYLYPLLWDPFVIAGTGSAPLLYDEKEAAAAAIKPRTLLIHAHSVPDEADRSLINNVLSHDGWVILQQPSAEL